MSKKLLIESQYFPPIAFFAQFLRFESVFLDPNERFQKQSYRNRCCILTSNKVLSLVVPVQKGKTQLTSGEVAVVYKDKWQLVHLRAIRSAYGRAPYFEHYFPQIEQIINTEHKTIFDLGKSTVEWAARILNIEFRILNNENLEGFLDGRSAIHPKGRSTEFQVQSSKESLNFKLQTLNSSYFQCFNHSGFVPNLSIIDLIMNEGPMSKAYLEKVVSNL
ncbi:MAG: WbqC family protein [Bacteroidia bacterium]